MEVDNSLDALIHFFTKNLLSLDEIGRAKCYQHGGNDERIYLKIRLPRFQKSFFAVFRVERKKLPCVAMPMMQMK